MLIGLLENGDRQLDFDGYSKVATEEEYNVLLKGKTDFLTEKEYQEFHFNIEAKRTGDPYALMQINKEILNNSVGN